MSYDGPSILASVPDANGNGIKDLDDLESVSDGMQIGALTDFAPLNHTLSMTVQLHSSADISYQGDNISTIFTATLHQNASQ